MLWLNFCLPKKSRSLTWVNMTLLGNKVIVNISGTVRSTGWRWTLMWWLLSLWEGHEWQVRRPSGDGRRGWNDSVRSQRYQEPPGAGRGNEAGLAYKLHGDCGPSTPWFPRFLASKMQDNRSIVYPACGTLLLLPSETYPSIIVLAHGPDLRDFFFSTKNTLSSLPAWTLPIHPSHPPPLPSGLCWQPRGILASRLAEGETEDSM